MILDIIAIGIFIIAGIGFYALSRKMFGAAGNLIRKLRNKE